MHANRRDFLVSTASLAGLAALGCQSMPTKRGQPFRISLAEWSLHRTLGSGAMTNLDFPKVARGYGIEGIEYVNSFFKDKARDKAYLDDLLSRCDGEGVRSLLIMVDGEGELAHENATERQKAVENHFRWLDCAAYLGCHSIRVNAGGGGDEAEKQKRAADSLVQLARHADTTGLNVIVENHGGSSSKGDWLAGVMKIANHPRVGTLPDFGNFNIGNGETYDRYKGVEELMPFAKAVSAKSHEFDSRGEEVHTDYHRMMRIVKAAGYSGFVGIEYEGSKHEEAEGIRLTKVLLERIQHELAE